MRTTRNHALITLFSLAISATTVSGFANFTALCEIIRKEYIESGKYSTPEDLDRLRCGSTYNAMVPPALTITTSLSTCMAQNGGFQQSNVLSQWATPLFAFLTPTLAFALVISRPDRFPTWRALIVEELNREKPLHQTRVHWMRTKATKIMGYLLIGIFATLDVIAWTIVVFVLAGPIIASAVYEASFDHFVLRQVWKQFKSGSRPTPGERLSISHALIVLLIGSFHQEDAIEQRVKNVMEDCAKLRKHAPRKLQQLVKLVPTFGDTIVGPALFFLGAFLYSLFDGKEKIGDNDLAHGTAFGIWYGVIVIAATTCTATLGVARPEAVEPIFPPAGAVQFQPRPSHTNSFNWKTTNGNTYKSERIWIRHRRFEEWINSARKSDKSSESPCDFYPKHKASLSLRAFAWLVAITSIGVPCGLAAAISYKTPTVSCMPNDLVSHAEPTVGWSWLSFYHSNCLCSFPVHLDLCMVD